MENPRDHTAVGAGVRTDILSPGNGPDSCYPLALKAWFVVIKLIQSSFYSDYQRQCLPEDIKK